MAEPFNLNNPVGGWSLSAHSAVVSGSAVNVSFGNGNFLLIVSASSNGPSGNASANLQLQHSHDLTAWTILQTLTASATGTTNPLVTAAYSGGAYQYVRANASVVYSAAQTGTGVLYAFIMPGSRL